MIQSAILSGILGFAVIVPRAEASWLSEATGIHVDLRRQIGIPATIDPATAARISVQEPGLAPQTIKVATADQVKGLKEKIDKATAAFEKLSRLYSTWAVGLAIFALVVALSSALSGFLRRPLLAGALSLVVVTVNGVPQIIPIRERCSFYQQLYAQASVLQIDMDAASDPFLLSQYNTLVEKLKTLLLASPPGIGDSQAVTRELIGNLRAAQQSAASSP